MMLWRSASELGQKYATKNYPSQGTPICRLSTAPAENLRNTTLSLTEGLEKSLWSLKSCTENTDAWKYLVHTGTKEAFRKKNPIKRQITRNVTVWSFDETTPRSESGRHKLQWLEFRAWLSFEAERFRRLVRLLVLTDNVNYAEHEPRSRKHCQVAAIRIICCHSAADVAIHLFNWSWNEKSFTTCHLERILSFSTSLESTATTHNGNGSDFLCISFTKGTRVPRQTVNAPKNASLEAWLPSRGSTALNFLVT